MRRLQFLSGLFLILFSAAAMAQEPVRHQLRASFEPAQHRFSAVDLLTIPAGHPRTFDFLLHRGLDPVATPPGVRLVSIGRGPAPHLEVYRLQLPPTTDTVELRYGGMIHHPPELYGEEHARGFRVSAGTIGEEGIYLGGESGWYPQTGDLVTFRIETTLPPGWEAVSQGGRREHARRPGESISVWEIAVPQEEIHLVGAPFVEYRQKPGRIEAMVFLRQADDQLAERYLDFTGRYLAMYEQLLGPYPYEKFALVENFWETGYGMPSFTLLGPKVLRFPFILYSSYPHEILHNWWGNGVYPDFERGNWSEGLTAYLSDHLLKEQQGQGAEYRQTTLQKYADYVRAGRDFPLTEFVGRHSSSSEAIGYGKAMMVFHMLRRQLGDQAFVEALRDFYRRRLFRVSGWDDLRRSFESAGGVKLGDDFAAWLGRSGAPELAVEASLGRVYGGGQAVRLILEQRQTAPPYRLKVPVAVTLKGQEAAYETAVELSDRRRSFDIPVPGQPLRVDVDPQFDLFRRLDREEIPPALSQALGAEKLLVLLPAAAPEQLRRSYQELAAALTQAGAGSAEVRLDKEFKELPVERSIILLGWENRFRSQVDRVLAGYGVDAGAGTIRLDGQELSRATHAAVVTVPHPEAKDQVLLWVACDRLPALPGLARKLPHYHKYSYLAFAGDEPANIVKGRWPVLSSPMSVLLPQSGGAQAPVVMGRLAPRPPLAELPAAAK